MQQLFTAELNAEDTPLSKDALCERAQDKTILVPTVTDTIDAEVIERLPAGLRLIANFGAGTDHIDLAAAKARGITVTNTPGVLAEDTADMTMALLLAAPRRMAEAAQMVRNNAWNGWAPTQLMGRRVSGKKLGIVGMGRIGQAVARRAAGFGLSIHYHNRHQLHASVEEELKATYWDALDDMLQEVDLVSLNCPYNKQTHHLIDAKRLARMKDTAYLVNTSRGAVIDEAALAKALAEGWIAGAGLDVYEQEPKIHEGLMGLQNVVLLPHISSATIESRTAMGEKVLINIKSFVDGHNPPDRVLID
tara:strand:- start:299 stop:1216 length:918 start_codon:yes stop_codon:yes gene_type:complete